MLNFFKGKKEKPLESKADSSDKPSFKVYRLFLRPFLTEFLRKHTTENPRSFMDFELFKQVLCAQFNSLGLEYISKETHDFIYKSMGTHILSLLGLSVHQTHDLICGLLMDVGFIYHDRIIFGVSINEWPMMRNLSLDTFTAEFRYKEATEWVVHLQNKIEKHKDCLYYRTALLKALHFQEFAKQLIPLQPSLPSSLESLEPELIKTISSLEALVVKYKDEIQMPFHPDNTKYITLIRQTIINLETTVRLRTLHTTILKTLQEALDSPQLMATPLVLKNTLKIPFENPFENPFLVKSYEDSIDFRSNQQNSQNSICPAMNQQRVNNLKNYIEHHLLFHAEFQSITNSRPVEE
jgi:hypothetical protein